MMNEQQKQAPRSLLPTLMGRLGLPTEHTSIEPTALKVRIDALQTHASLETLLSALDDEDESVRTVAVRALEQWNGRVPLERIVACLNDSSWLVREAAVLTLGAWGEEISAFTRDDNEFVREAVTLVQQQSSEPDTRIVSLQSSKTKVVSALTCVDRLLHAFVLAGSEGRTMDSQGDKQLATNSQETLREGEQRGRRRTVLGVTGGVLAVLVVVGIVFSWLAATQKLPFTTAAQKKSLDTPLLTTTNQMQSPSIRWSPDSHYIIESDPYNLPDATVVNIATKAEVQREVFDPLSSSIQQTNRVNSYWTPDGRYLVNSGADAATGQITLEFWNVVTNQKVLTVSYQDKSILRTGSALANHTNWSDSPYVTMAPDGIRFAFGKSDGTIEIWDITTGSKIATYKGDPSAINNIQWASHHQELFLSQSATGVVQLWNTSHSKPLLLFHAPFVKEQNYTQDASGQVVATPITVPASMSLSSDGTHMVTATNSNTIQIWDTSTGQLVATYHEQTPYGIDAAYWLQDSRHIVFTSSRPYSSTSSKPGEIGILDSSTGRSVLSAQIVPNGGYYFSPSEKYLMVNNQDGKSVTVWDVAIGRQGTTYHNATKLDTLFDNNTVLWSPDERYVATLSKDALAKSQNNVIQVWDARTGKVVATYHSHSNQVLDVQWSPNGKYLATVSNGDLGNVFEVWQAPN